MRIVGVTVDLVHVEAAEPFRWRDGLPGSEPALVGGVLKIHTDAGVVGTARTNRGVIVRDIVERRFAEAFVGLDPLEREKLWRLAWEIDRIERFPVYLIGLLDVALWDLAGKVAQEPVYRLLGGFRSQIPAYASTVTFGSVEEYLDVADQCLALGYPAIKLHAWGDARRDAALCAALREHVGPDVPLMYDGSAGFDLPDAVHLGRVLAEHDYLWYEEPIREYSITAYARLAERVDVPLLVAETTEGAHLNTADFVASGCASYVRTSAGFKGGITGAMRIAHLAEAFQLRAEVHGSGPVNRHLCMAIPNATYYESLVTTNPVRREACVDENGMVQAPREPGI
ncbi:racemase [Jiangella aurantiaca]|uniref:Racemase n=1 Tax=Jiangella aurantiaca TaxID=2530373 RepID=A0A4R5AF05_9ACTN|nr:racemase [Jiangella aurantiaca]